MSVLSYYHHHNHIHRYHALQIFFDMEFSAINPRRGGIGSHVAFWHVLIGHYKSIRLGRAASTSACCCDLLLRDIVNLEAVTRFGHQSNDDAGHAAREGSSE